MAAALIPPAPTDSAAQWEWDEWYKKVRDRANNPELTGSINLGTTNYIQGGQTDYNTGTGFFLGYSGGEYKFSVGDGPSGDRLTWDGSAFTLVGQIITAANIVDGAVTSDAILDEAITAIHLADEAVTAAKTALAAIDPTSGELALNSVTASNVVVGSLTGVLFQAETISADKLNVENLAAINANLGTITAGNISGVTITGSLIRTAASGQRIEIDSSGIALLSGAATGKYAEFQYGDGTKYGQGALAYINNVDIGVPFYIQSEQAVADFHFYNRGSDPSGAAEVGDICVVSGKLKICTAAGTPGTWTIVGTQS
jgi:hypothetical protein